MLSVRWLVDVSQKEVEEGVECGTLVRTRQQSRTTAAGRGYVGTTAVCVYRVACEPWRSDRDRDRSRGDARTQLRRGTRLEEIAEEIAGRREWRESGMRLERLRETETEVGGGRYDDVERCTLEGERGREPGRRVQRGVSARCYWIQRALRGPFTTSVDS